VERFFTFHEIGATRIFERSWEYYSENRIWHPDANIDIYKITMQIYGEQTQAKGPLPSPAKYLDQGYLKEALRELQGSKSS